MNVHLTHRDIAELVNASRSRVTIYLQQLAQEGGLIYEGRRIIIILKKIEALLGLTMAA